MEDAHAQICRSAVRLARFLADGTLQSLAQAIMTSGPEWSQRRQMAAQVVPQPGQRALVFELMATWQQHAPLVMPAELALALRAAAAAVQAEREAQSVELLWTGPLVSGATMRRTDQALLELIHGARQSLLIVSFAVYKIPAIADALVQAAGRGVAIRICVEAPEPSGQKMAYDTVKALGPAVAQRAALYVWPSEQREKDANGHVGVLHAKCAVADEKALFISSANLTEYAMSLNMELGALIHSASQAKRVIALFDQMIAQGILQPAPTPT